DFGDLLMKTYELYLMYPDVLEQHQNKFQYILVDEYQDTNQIQYLLVKLLSQKNRNLCVVGDEDQSIYSWRGADISNILNFEKDYPEAVVIKLEENYRSSKTIVSAASQLIRHNTQRKDKTLFTQQMEGDPIRVFEAGNEYDEARWVIKNIQNWIDSGEFLWSDCAVFYRTNAQSRVLEEQLRLNSIPYQIVGGMRFFDRTEIKDVLSYMKLALNPADDMALKRIFNVPTRGLGKTSLENLEEKSFELGVNLRQLIPMAVDNRWFHAGTTSKLRELDRILQDLEKASIEKNLLEFYQYILERTSYMLKLRVENSPEADSRIENLEELSNVIAQFMKERSEAQLQSFLEEMALVSDVEQAEEALSKVTLMTLHVSKGLEFPIVFIVGLEENLFPSGAGQFDESAEDSLEEERRLAYVGMTRARQKLHLSYATTRKVWGQDQNNPPSRFLREIPEEFLQRTGGGQKSSFLNRWGSSSSFGQRPSSIGGNRNSLFNSIPKDGFESQSFSEEADESGASHPDSGGYWKGMRVRHPSFGVGSVYQVEGAGADQKISVLFSDQTLKKFVARYARLEKI
ncbi:MAG: 3'-5' exonuclease, partial [Bdellovibrio sp.]